MMARRARACCLLLGLLALLAGCSSPTFVYNRLDFLLPWYIQSYADLDREQEDYLDELLDPFLRWHRTQELPCYATLVDRAENMLSSDALSAGDIDGLMRAFESAWYRTEAEALERLLALGEKLTDKQIAAFLAELEERHKDLEKEYLPRSDDEFFDDSYDAMVDTAQDFLGRLQPPQRDLLRAGSRELKRADDVWLAERAAFLQRLASLLERKPGWQQGVREIIATRDTAVSAQYTELLNYNVAVLQGLAANVLNIRSQRQDARVRKRLAGYRNDFITLAVQGGSEGGAHCAAAQSLPGPLAQQSTAGEL
ncbi:MAG: hypothetical protein KDI09_08940 [Halioglobus sp.]|nr:hypothetical protein [Halioglobus sp.]